MNTEIDLSELSFQDKGDKISQKTLVIDFMRQLKLPKALVDKFWLAEKEMRGVPDPEAIFHEAFPSFPLLITAYPQKSGKEIKEIRHILGERGQRLYKEYYNRAEQYIDYLEDRALMMLIHFPYMKDVYCVHNIQDAGKGRPRIVVPGSTGEYELTIQSAGTVLEEHSEYIREYIQFALAGET